MMKLQVLACILSIVNDILLVKKAILRELQTVLKELILNKNGRRPLLQLSYNLLTLSLSDVLSLLISSLPPLVANNRCEVMRNE
ncbi:hypothetical protein Tco_0190891 [Tanacetum coccineum]